MQDLLVLVNSSPCIHGKKYLKCEVCEKAMMDANLYQNLAARTLVGGDENQLSRIEFMVVWNAFGIAGESGELVDLLKKAVFHRHGINKEKVAEEVGDLMWYIAGLCTVLEIELGDVMRGNVEKLMKRYPDGFDFEKSKHSEAAGQ